ncbi:MAG: DUF4230 domain-containing protein [Anaerolineales bacterium]|nr:DUF4230 domain-containing protein [Anaerolineales bacterium]MCS7248031.1 DUF4230 domain-containing protein [Anaerolineales bacterium]MDW8161843.1 DUF4230 domain-containing protein [Anaerolineales bacterium]MDW8446605.1 DUF4230 domain-containing protein [Anaerolineales bacterium]
MGKSNNLPLYVLGVLLIGAFLLIGFLMVNAVEEGIRQAQSAVRPLSELTQNLSTQVAQALSPTPTILPDPVTIVHSIRSLARLETIQYSVEKVITAESGQGTFGFLFGDRLLLIAHGVVIAGVDLEKLSPRDLRLENGVLYVRLPEAEIFVATLDNSKSYVYDRETGLLTRGNIHLETEARQAAEEEIRKAALEDGILEQANRNAQAYLLRLFLQLGYRDVVFEEQPRD